MTAAPAPSGEKRNTPEQEAAFLRAEGRFAVMAGGLLMALGLILACGLGIASLAGAVESWLPAAVAAAPVALGWAALTYGAWRFEQAQAVRKGRRPRRLHVRLSAQRLRAAAQKRRRSAQAADPAANPEDQAHWKL